MSQNPLPSDPIPPPPGDRQDTGGWWESQFTKIRRAAILLFVLGGLMSVCGLCVSGIATSIPADQLAAQMPIPLPPEVSSKMLVGVMVVVWLVVALFGIAKVTLGIFVYNGRRGAIVAAIVIAGLLVLLAGISFLNDLRLALTSGSAVVAGGALLAALIVGALILELIWLIQAAQAASAVKKAWESYYARYWKTAQAAAHPQSPGYWGYGLPPPPPGQGAVGDMTALPDVPPPVLHGRVH